MTTKYRNSPFWSLYSFADLFVCCLSRNSMYRVIWRDKFSCDLLPLASVCNKMQQVFIGDWRWNNSELTPTRWIPNIYKNKKEWIEGFNMERNEDKGEQWQSMLKKEQWKVNILQRTVKDLLEKIKKIERRKRKGE